MLQKAAKYCKNAQICCKWFICCREALEMTLTKLDKMFGVLLGSINIVFNWNAAKYCKMLQNTTKIYNFVANGHLQAVSPMISP